MDTAHKIISDYIAVHAIDTADFWTWFKDAGYSEEKANVHDSAYLALLEDYVEERDAHEQEPAAKSMMLGIHHGLP